MNNRDCVYLKKKNTNRYKELEEKADLETETVNDIYKILEKINKD